MIKTAILSAQNPVSISDSTKIRHIDSVIVVAHNKRLSIIPDGYQLLFNSKADLKGKEVSDLLKTVPSIQLLNGSLGMVGKEGVLVFINHKLVRLDGRSLLSYLNSIPVSNIKSIRVMTIPPSQYDAEGNVGVIRIATRDILPTGINGLVKWSFGQNTYSSYMGSAYIGYNNSKLSFNGTLSYDNINYLNKTSYLSYYPQLTASTSNPKRWNMTSAMLNLDLSYKFNEKMSVSVDLSCPLHNSERISDLDNRTEYMGIMTNAVDSVLLSHGKTTSNTNKINSGLCFNYHINDSTIFSVNTNYLKNAVKTNRNFSSSLLTNGLSSPQELYWTSGKVDYDIITAATDLETVLFTCKFNTGAKFSYINTQSADSYIGNFNDHNTFRYKENVDAIYFSGERKINNWIFKGGLRFEYTFTTGESVNYSETEHNKYFHVFPTISILYKLGENSNISFQYSARIERPPYKYLDPFKWYITKYSYSAGNPLLRPSYINNYELNYLFRESFSARLYYTSQTNQIGKLVILDKEDVLKQAETANNFLDVKKLGMNIYKYVSPFEWCKTVIQCDFSKDLYYSKKQEFKNISGYEGSFYLYNSFSIKKQFIIDCNLTENLPGLYNYRKRHNAFQADIAFKYIHKKTGMEFKLEISDIFKTAEPEYTYKSDG
ncbi:MAG TPA: TonB-dependent receptor, partial [Candidatus Egerieousia sp.]|nr:TonB-dependent receptor [Candidatus Egerieousia sp.]